MALINGDNAANTLFDNPAEDDTINGLGGNDTISVSGRFDVIDGGSDSDRLVVRYGAATGPVFGGVLAGNLASGYSGSFTSASAVNVGPAGNGYTWGGEYFVAAKGGQLVITMSRPGSPNVTKTVTR